MCSLNGRMREKVGIKVVKALKRHDDGVTYSAIDMLCALIQVPYVLILNLVYIYIICCIL